MFIADARRAVSSPRSRPSRRSGRRTFQSHLWREGAAQPSVYVSPVHPRLSDNRLTADIVGAVRSPGRDGRRLPRHLGAGRTHGAPALHDRVRRSIRLPGDRPERRALFTNNLQPNTGPIAAHGADLDRGNPRAKAPGISIATAISTPSTRSTRPAGWRWSSSRRPPPTNRFSDLLGKITFPAVWLILLTAVGAWLAGKFTRRQAEAARRIEREVIFNEKILANMPSGIALVDPSSRNFLQANDAFARMAKCFGGLPTRRRMSTKRPTMK